MHYVVHCTDRPGRLQVRRDTRPAHIEYLDGKAAMIRVAGPYMQEDGETPMGSILIVECDSLAEAEAFAAGDPYAKAGLFDSVSVRPFRWGLGSIKPE